MAFLPALVAGASVLSGAAGLMTGMYQAQVAQNNAKIMQRNAETALEAGQNAESMQRIKTGKEVAAVRAGAAAHGVDVNTGTPLDVQTATATSGELDALAVRYNAARQAYGYGVEAQNYKSQASMDQYAGVNSMLQGVGNAASSYIGMSKSMQLAGANGGF